MLLRQLFDHESFTYTYLLADEQTQQAVLIDPVDTRLEQYISLLEELELTLVAALDTHVHADHVTALGLLRDMTGCETFVGEQSGVECASCLLTDGDAVDFGSLSLRAIYTPGHTDDSYSFYMPDQGLLFTGDTLFIRGSGRTDFQNGNPEQLFDSLYDKLLVLPGDTVVYPGHDYQGLMQSTLAEEISNNPRLQCASKADFIAMMNALNLPQPKHIHVAVPANRECGKRP